MQLLLVLRVDVLQLRIVVVGVGESAPLTDMRRLLIMYVNATYHLLQHGPTKTSASLTFNPQNKIN